MEAKNNGILSQPKIEHKKRRQLLSVAVFFCLWILISCREGTADTAVTTDTTSRAIQNKGSDTLVNIALAWAETYRDVDPTVSIAVTGGGSGTGIAALVNGTVDIANASRAMKDSEIEEAQANGIDPIEHTVAIDALAVIVHPDNPVSQLTIDQLSDMYTGRITNWKDVGGNDAPIVLLSRETNSGTHVYFLEEVVRKGSSDNEDIFAPQTLLMPSSVGITSELRRNPNAIGYDGLGYVDPEHEKVLLIATDADSSYVPPTAETASSGKYPLARDLYMYTTGEPTGVVAEYLDWILSAAGQEIVAQLGFVPLTTSN
ncbi:MAG: phosphate ABC transporter substrate-binding protein [Ardenticatenaceae bacterium]|nr:phosphate ABC transporter substrate-binding protein [Ardenticatenaceae bacterium]